MCQVICGFLKLQELIYWGAKTQDEKSQELRKQRWDSNSGNLSLHVNILFGNNILHNASCSVFGIPHRGCGERPCSDTCLAILISPTTEHKTRLTSSVVTWICSCAGRRTGTARHCATCCGSDAASTCGSCTRAPRCCPIPCHLPSSSS